MLWRAIEELGQEYDKENKGIVGFKVGKDRMVSATVCHLISNSPQLLYSPLISPGGLDQDRDDP